MTRDDILQPVGKLLINQPVEPSITFRPGDPSIEVMRIDRYGVKVNSAFTVDEATQHVLDALTAHIQHTINHAVAAEREACAKVCDVLGNKLGMGREPDPNDCAASIRARRQA